MRWYWGGGMFEVGLIRAQRYRSVTHIIAAKTHKYLQGCCLNIVVTIRLYNVGRTMLFIILNWLAAWWVKEKLFATEALSQIQKNVSEPKTGGNRTRKTLSITIELYQDSDGKEKATIHVYWFVVRTCVHTAYVLLQFSSLDMSVIYISFLQIKIYIKSTYSPVTLLIGIVKDSNSCPRLLGQEKTCA